MADETCSPCDDVLEICISSGPPGPRGSVGKITQFIFYPSVGTTDITGTDKSGTLMEVDPDGCLVSINGVMLEPGADYTIAADGLTVTLSEGIVNANDVLTVQTWKSDEQANDNVLDLKLEVEKNTSDIAGLDVRVTQNEDDIETLQNAAQSFTTRDVKVSGVNTTRAVDEPLQTQQDVNIHLDQSIANVEERVESIESGQPTLDADLESLREDIDENTQGISDNTGSISELSDVVSDNVDDISSLQEQVNNIPPPTDISELSDDVDEIAKQVGTNTIAIAKNTEDIAALPEMTIDLEPLSDAIETNAAGISANASDIKDIKATDAKQQGEINDLKSDVAELQDTEFDTTGLAVVDEDNKFSVSQTIKDGVTITGSKAFLNLDKGSPLSISNGNFSNSVVEIKRSTGDTAISLEASGHIRGVKTDTDPSCAVSLEYFQANVGAGGGDVDMSLYATKLELTDEEKARILGDQKLAADLDEAIKTEKYNDTELRNKISAEEKARAAGDSNLSNQIANETKYRKDEDAKLQEQIDALEIPAVDPELYATVEYVDNLTADFATENFVEEAIGAIEFPEDVDLTGYATEEFVTEAIAAIPEVSLDGYATEEFVTNAIAAIEFPAGTVVGETPPADAEEGATWYDTARLELFVFASNAWLPCSPLGARVEQGEVVQAQIIDQIQHSLVEQEAIKDKVAALEGAVGEHSLLFTSANANPREGEFNLKNSVYQLVSYLSDAQYITLNETDRNGISIDLGRLVVGDVLRLSDISRQAAELKITEITDESIFTFEKLSGDLERFSEGPYDFMLLSSFDPTGLATIDYVDERDEAVKEYTDQQLVDVAKTSTRNTFKEIQTFEKSTYFQTIVIHNGKFNDTLTEVRGEHEDTKQLWHKIRGTSKVSWICYPGQENVGYKRCLEMEWDQEADRPLVKLDYLQPPTQNRHAATKQYVDDELAKVGGGSDGATAKSGTTTPSLSTGEMFFNTNDKVLYIGE